jgi:hypothetical protein
MIQVLDLARENAALKHEVDRLRNELAEVLQTTIGSGVESGSGTAPCLAEPGDDRAGRALRAGVQIASRLALVVPRHLAMDYGLFADRSAEVPACRVIVDRRVTERRFGSVDYGGHERRQRDRRSGQRDAPDALVVSLRDR